MELQWVILSKRGQAIYLVFLGIAPLLWHGMVAMAEAWRRNLCEFDFNTWISMYFLYGMLEYMERARVFQLVWDELFKTLLGLTLIKSIISHLLNYSCIPYQRKTKRKWSGIIPVWHLPNLHGKGNKPWKFESLNWVAIIPFGWLFFFCQKSNP